MLGIQKFVLVLSDFHYNEFIQYLKNSRAELPLKLVAAIKDSALEQLESDELCEKIYGEKDEKSKKKFLQLTHHTLKLGFYLSRNYPAFLKHNVSNIEVLIASGDLKKANFYADCLLDISEKLEDYSTQISVLKFLSQQAFISENGDAVHYLNKIKDALHHETQINEIYLYLRTYFPFKGRESMTKSKQAEQFFPFENYKNSKSFCVNILARFTRIYELHFMNMQEFYSKDCLNELEEIENDLYKNAYIIFPFLEDIYFKVLGLKLQFLVHQMDSAGMMKESRKMIEESSYIKFWSSYVNVPELFAIAIQASHLISHHGDTYRHDHLKNLPSEIKNNIDFVKSALVNELNKPIWNEGNIIKQINARSFYASILMLGDEAEIKKGCSIIEETLITFQQIPFQKFLDGMFASLSIGYFSLKQYEKVVETYKRFKKLTSATSVIEENDFTISAYYYTAQWVSTGRKQYVEKLSSVFEESCKKENLLPIQKLIINLNDYFKIGMKLEV